MCETYPGPRCSNHARQKLVKARTALKYAVITGTPLEQLQARAHYYVARNEYLRTPEGIATLPENSEEAARSVRIRERQIISLREQKNGRAHLITQLAMHRQTFHDETETASILDSVREWELHQNTDEANTPETLKTEYEQLLSSYPDTPATRPLLEQLRELPPPTDAAILRAYRKLPNGLEHNKYETRKALKAASHLQGATYQQTAAYYDAYREQYTTEYATLPPKQRPVAPQEWIDGDHYMSGYRNAPGTRFIATDPASMYALGRLNADPHAIPDYMKSTPNYAIMTVHPTQGRTITPVTTKGMLTGETVSEKQNPYAYFEAEKESTLICGNDEEAPQHARHVNLATLAQTHLAYSSSSPDTLLATYGNEGDTPQQKMVRSFFAAKTRMQKQWNSKTVRKTATPLLEIPLTSRWM